MQRGAYIAGASFTRGLNPAGRIYNSPLGPADPGGRWPDANITNRTFATPNPETEGKCHRPSDPSTRWDIASASPDFVSPDAIFLATISAGDPQIGEEYVLAPGADPVGVPSYRIICNVSVGTGVFMIDTTCVSPANHLVFIDDSWPPDEVYPTFEAGRIGVGGDVGACSPAACSCPCHADPIDCGGTPLGILDVVSTIDVAFRAVPATRSPNCPYENTDLDCNRVTDIVDVVSIIDVEFRGVPVSLRVCSPCGTGN